MPRYTATPLFNAAYDSLGPDEVPMIGGQRYAPYMEGWKPGVPLKPSILTQINVEAQDEHYAAQAVFTALNRDDRPNGRSEPSISVGDIIIIHTHDMDVPFAVRPVGFDAVNMFEVDEAIVRH